MIDLVMGRTSPLWLRRCLVVRIWDQCPVRATANDSQMSCRPDSNARLSLGTCPSAKPVIPVQTTDELRQQRLHSLKPFLCCIRPLLHEVARDRGGQSPDQPDPDKHQEDRHALAEGRCWIAVAVSNGGHRLNRPPEPFPKLWMLVPLAVRSAKVTRPAHANTSVAARGPRYRAMTVTAGEDTALTRSLEKLASMYPEADGKQPLKDLPNEVALSLWIEVGETKILLGSDMESGPTDCGWKGVLARPEHPTEKAHVFKVAHHGRKSGHYEQMVG
jgi:hypothetical protein